MRLRLLPLVSITCGLALITAACASPPASIAAAAEPYLTPLDALRPASLEPDEKLRVLATTSIVADAVAQVGGDQIEVHQLIPLGVDPHAFEPTPRDARALAEADIVFVNGFGLEAFMADLIQQAGSGVPVISVSEGIEPLPFEGEERVGGEGEGEQHEHGADPHTWLDPNNVIRWTQNIETALGALDPGRAEAYTANGESYRSELAALDAQIREAVSRIPEENRKLVTDHDELGYFADEYGFTVVGTVIPGASSLADPSAAELTALLDRVRAQAVPAVFVSSVVNPALVEIFAADAGMRVAALYAHSLTAPDGPAPSYLELMRYNAETIAAALTP
jgi:ABC-type Zn uptake system ZnuABC Zn-binding protein ZnuA